MPFIRVYLHFVWATKNRYPYLKNRNLRYKLWMHIRANGLEKGIYVDMVNGFHDHCHVIVSLKANQTIAKLIKDIKGESSRWINKNKLTESRFIWQEEYFVESISARDLQRIRNYLINQEKHHGDNTLYDELELPEE